MKVVTLIHKGKVQTVTIEELKKMKIELTQRWEGLCQKCGKCCFDKKVTEKGAWVINYSRPCQFLKFVGRRAECEVYTDRFDKCEQCNTIPEAIQKRYLPADCPYVKAIPIYKAPVDDGNWYKMARKKLSRFDDDEAVAGTPTGGTRDAYASPPPRVTGQESLAREDLAKPADWKRRRLERRRRAKGGQQGILDPREKTVYNIKPSGHAGGG